jgi:N6-L-threonylcarbamoyladenine synthase
MYILGIETSCDETSCAVLKNYKVLSNITISSLKEHQKYGGIVPEIATRAHLKNIDKVLKIALEEANISIKKINLIACTYKPGLIGALVIGLNFAKTLSLSLNKPFIGVNHLHAHLFSPFLNYKRRLKFPFLGVVVSGGHTQVYYVKDFDQIKTVGTTVDDACGEVFDKVARFYGLGYPGGPIIDRLFNIRYKDAFKFKCGKMGLNLSFSGIKTALIYKKMELEKEKKIDGVTKIKLISSFQEVVFDTLISVILEATEKYKTKRVVCGGGVMANRHLRKKIGQIKEIDFIITPLEFATDNASMVAGLGFYLYNKKGIKSEISLQAESN